MPRPTKPSADERPARRPRRRRVLFGTLIALAALAAVVWFLRAGLLERVVTRLARTRAGLEVRFDGLEIEGLSRIRAARVEVDAIRDGEVLRHAEIEDLELVVHVRGLWTDEVVVESIGARRGSVELDLRRAEPSAPSTGAPIVRLPDAWPGIRIDDLDLDVAAGAGRASLRGARIDLGARPGTGGLAITARTLALADERRSASGALEMRAAVGDGSVAVEVARWEGVAEIRDGRFTPGKDGGFDARLELATRIGSAELEARSDARDLRIRGTLERVDLASVLRLLGVKTDEYGGTWSARGSCVLPLARPGGFTVDADLIAAEPLIVGRGADLIAGRFLATESTYEVRDATVQAGANRAHVQLVRVPRDTDLGCEFLERATIVLDADLADVEPLLGSAWSVPDDAPPHRVRGRAALADGWVAIESARAEIGASLVEVGLTRVPVVSGPQPFLLNPSTEVELEVRAPDSAELARLLLPASVAEGLAIDGEVSGFVRLRPSATGVSARLRLRARDAALRGVRIDELALLADLDAGVLTIERADLRAGPTTMRAGGAIDVRARRFTGLDVEADVPDVRSLGTILGHAAEWPDGRARLRARLDGPIEAPEGTLSADATDVRLAGIDVSSIRLRAHGADGAIVVDDLAAELPLVGTIDTAGRAQFGADGAWTVDVERLALDALEGELDLVRPARVTIEPDLVTVRGLDLAGGDGALRVEASGGAGGLCADVAVEAVSVGRILRAFGVRVPESLRLDGRATVDLAGLDTGSVDGHVDAEMRATVLDLADLELPRGFTAGGRGTLQVNVSGPWRDPVGVVAVEAHGLVLRDATGFARLAGAELLARARVAEQVELETFELQLSRDSRVLANGTAALPFDLDRIARGDFSGNEDARIDVAVAIDAPDLAPLGDAFEALRRTAGSLAADVVVAGTIGAPEIAGHVTLRSGAVKLSATLPAISEVEVDLVIAEERVTIERAAGAYGGGEVELSGSVAIDGPEPVFALVLHGRSVPLLRSAEVSVRTDVDVEVAGAWSALEVTGVAALRDARFEQRLDLDRLRALFESKPGGGGGGRLLELPAITEAPFGAMKIRLDITSDKPVRVRTPLLRAEIVTRFTIRGTGANPQLGGSLEVEGGRIALPASKLDLSRGRIDFDPNDPGRARLDVSAEGRVSGYDVTARVTGTTDEPEIELNSIPPATQEDLVLLLLAGRVPGSHGLGLDEDRVVGEVAAYVARDLAYEWFGDAGESFADRLELATGADVTQSGADTIEVRFRLTGAARGPGRAVYLRGDRDVYDRINMGIRFVLRTP